MKEAYGNMLDTTCEVLVVSTNGYVKKDGSCVMGRGIAEQISNLFPEVAFTLGGLIRGHGNICHILSHPTNRNVGFVSFPVKPVTSHVLPDKSNVVPHARNKVKCGDLLMGFWSIANLRLIEDSCKQLVRLADDNGWSDILCPRFGCGAGELRWQDVKPICEKYLDNRFTVMTFKEDQVLETQFQKSIDDQMINIT